METIKVGNYEIGDKEVKNAMAHLPEQQQMFASSPSFQAKIEQNLKDMAALATYAEEIGLMDSDNYKASINTAKRDILCQLGMLAVMDEAQVEDEELKAQYDENQDKFVAPERVSARHILVKEEDEANKIKAQIENGEYSFEDAAKEFSTCPSYESGGDLGMFARGQMVPEFEEVCFAEEVGKLVGPVKTQFGYHLILVTEKHEAGQLKFEDVKEQLKQELLKARQEAAYEAKIYELRERFGITPQEEEESK